MPKENNILARELDELLNRKFSGPVADRYRKRLSEGRLTIQENPLSHFCLYFAAFDPDAKKVFIGHHKKSGLWLFNGGHIDAGEIITETRAREIKEEWGLDANNFELNEPELITVTDIENPAKQTCREHLDLWCFVPVVKSEFFPRKKNLDVEFIEIGWKSPMEARVLVTDKSTLEGIGFIEEHFFKP